LGVDGVEVASKPAPTLSGVGGLRVFFGLVAVVRAGFVEALGVDVVALASKPAPTADGLGGESGLTFGAFWVSGFSPKSATSRQS